MSNNRCIAFFLSGILLTSAVLVFLSWRTRAVASEATRNTLCTLAPEAVEGIEISRNGTNIVKLTRNDSGAWSIVNPYFAPADAAPVARLVDALTLLPLGDMRTESELASLGEDFADFGLAGTVRASVKLIAKGGESQVFFGALSASGKDVYARADGLLNVFTVGVEALEAIPVDADGFRVRTLISSAGEQISSLDLHKPEAPFIRLVRSASGWRLSSPVEAPADETVVSALVDGLVGARIVGFVMPSAAHATRVGERTVLSQSALAPYGLAAEAGLSISVKSDSGTSEQIVFGSSAGTNLVYALVQNGTAVVTMPAAVADLFRTREAALRDSRVFPFGADEQVKSVSITAGKLVYVLARGANGDWRLAAPVAAPADPAAAAALVDAVLRIRRNDVLQGAPLDGEDAVRVSVATSSGGHPGVSVAKSVFKECGSFADLRSKTLLELDVQSIRRLSLKPLEGVGGAVVLNPERNQWNLAEGSAPATVRVDAVKTLLAALTRVEAKSVETMAATPDDLRRCGLDAPTLVIAVDFEGQDAVRRNIMLGAVAPGGGRYATVGGADAVFVLDRSTTSALMVSITE